VERRYGPASARGTSHIHPPKPQEDRTPPRSNHRPVPARRYPGLILQGQSRDRMRKRGAQCVFAVARAGGLRQPDQVLSRFPKPVYLWCSMAWKIRTFRRLVVRTALTPPGPMPLLFRSARGRGLLLSAKAAAGCFGTLTGCRLTNISLPLEDPQAGKELGW